MRTAVDNLKTATAMSHAGEGHSQMRAQHSEAIYDQRRDQSRESLRGVTSQMLRQRQTARDQAQPATRHLIPLSTIPRAGCVRREIGLHRRGLPVALTLVIHKQPPWHQKERRHRHRLHWLHPRMFLRLLAPTLRLERHSHMNTLRRMPFSPSNRQHYMPVPLLLDLPLCQTWDPCQTVLWVLLHRLLHQCSCP